MLAVASTDIPRAQQILDEHWNRGLDEAGRRATEAVFDLDAESSPCPACTDPIPQGTGRCPSCGLRLF